MPIISHNPATGEDIQKFHELTDEEIQEKIAKAQSAFNVYKKFSIEKRSEMLKSVAAHLRENKVAYGTLITEEIGRPLAPSIAEIEKCALACDYYAEQGPEMLKPEMVVTEARESYVTLEPLGIVFAVMPWNFPFWQVLRFAAPALIAGNVGLLKPASNVPRCAEAIESIFLKCGYDEGIFQNLFVSGGRTEIIIRDPRVKAVTLTGSEWAGRKVAEIAGDEIKPSVLELGGSDAFIVLASADIEKAARVGAQARLQNCGQSCIAAKRFIIEESVYDKFLELFTIEFKNFVPDDPKNPDTKIGPVATQSGLEDVEKQVVSSIEKGASVAIGGKRIEKPGYFYSPTILTGVKSGMPAYNEEIFGPVASVIKVRDEAEAITVANDSPFGLGSSLWSNDREQIERIIPQIEAGCVFVNSMVKSDPRLPFGGVKKSGYGRELSYFGLREFVNVKTVSIE
ncbi:MAG TPA: NAD-dependent succinate-semialdehyde dehydrogenase [Candidatus Magasanikbacteria bacterium]|nr:NAD-dependent succinate-semialdehyde dehydrogenase [Candidatus Magasanikbacteria bacterium]